MTFTIINGAPMTNRLGTSDISTRSVIPEPEALPSHLPKQFFYAQKGTTEPQLVIGADLVNTYGADTFDLRKKYANHATVMATNINATGNALMAQRIVPDDAPPPANFRLWLDVLVVDIPQYQRNSDGSFKRDVDNLRIPVVGNLKLPGYRAKWVITAIATVGNENGFGIGTQQPGDQTDALTSTTSTRYPVGDFEVPDQGEDGNNRGIRIWAPTLQSDIPLDGRLLISDKVFPFRMACVKRPAVNKTPAVVRTMKAEQFVNVCFKPGVIDDNTEKQLYAGTEFIKAYQDLDTANATPLYGPFGRHKLYDANIKTLVDMFYAAEFDAEDPFSDFTGATDESYLFNMIGGNTSQNTPYLTYELVTGTANSVQLTESTTLYARGGGDGTMSNANFATSVIAQMANYLDPTHPWQDTARYPESIIYDSGFPIDAKKALINMISLRKDTAVVLGTHDASGPALTASEESSLALALRSRCQLFPDSEYFGTGVFRAMIVGRSGTLANSLYAGRLPLTHEIAVKAARYMGAGDGKWKQVYNFDMSPNNAVEMFTDVNVTFTPASAKIKDWANGLNWVDYYTRRTLYFPALRTVRDDDTSVLTSFFTMMAVVECQKIGERVHRKFSGESSLTRDQLIERANKDVLDKTANRFDGRFIITPDAHFTESDKLRGYSWTLYIKLQAPNMVTVTSLAVVADRIDQ